jgi:Mce-associated membrane protein
MADADEESQDAARAKLDALALAEQAEAEAAEAEALAAAARARARAIKLRREAQSEAVDGEADEAAEESEPAEAPETPEPSPSPKHEATEGESADRWRVNVSLALSVAAVVGIVGFLGASGWMFWRHHNVVQEREHAAAYTAAARQGVINLTSLDFNKAKDNVQRVLDSATGEFKDDFQKRAEDFESVVKDSKAVTEGSVAASAVESMTKDSAVVLVLANENVTNIAGAKDQPRTFRFRVSVVHDGDDLKLSKVEFVL